MPEPMKPTDVPNDLAMVAAARLREFPKAGASEELFGRRILAAVLPLHEQQVREQIALGLERKSNKRDQDAERHADERSPLLQAQAEALWDAARAIRAGESGDVDD
jgi:hypothetical protein